MVDRHISGNGEEQVLVAGEDEARSVAVGGRWRLAREPRDAIAILPSDNPSVGLLVVGKDVIQVTSISSRPDGLLHSEFETAGMLEWEASGGNSRRDVDWATTAVMVVAAISGAAVAGLFVYAPTYFAIQWLASLLGSPVSGTVVVVSMGYASAVALVLAGASRHRTLIRRPIPDPGDLPQLETLWASAAARAVG